jgi:hypothetical protein
VMGHSTVNTTRPSDGRGPAMTVRAAAATPFGRELKRPGHGAIQREVAPNVADEPGQVGTVDHRDQ